MSGTLNSQAVKLINNIAQAAQQAIALNQAIAAIDAAWNDIGAATVIAAMSTTAVGADGSPGATDGSPNVTHPINTTLYPQMTQAISSNQIAAAKTILDAIQTLMSGSAVTAQTGARAILNLVING